MKKSKRSCSRREFLRKQAITGLGAFFLPGAASNLFPAVQDGMSSAGMVGSPGEASAEPAAGPPGRGGVQPDEQVIDIHVHLNHGGRGNDQLLSHQQSMGVTETILLPAGRTVNRPSTLDGRANGLGGNPLMLGNEACYRFAEEHANVHFGVNEVPDLSDTIHELEKYLKLGAKVIGESKFGVECDSPEMQRIYELAGEYGVPVLMHWQYGSYNHGFARFHRMLEKYPGVNFIGHAQTWWANIDRNHTDQSVLYPDTKITPGGLTDRLLSDYPNMYGDLSAGSGLNALLRDEEHAAAFLDRHQDKLLFGSDDTDITGTEPECRGARAIETIRRLSSGRRVARKVLYENAARLFRL